MRTTNRSGILKQFEALAGEAVEVVRQLLRDPDTPQSVRLRAAKLILTACMGGRDDDEPVEKAIPIARPGPRLVRHNRGSKPEHAA